MMNKFSLVTGDLVDIDSVVIATLVKWVKIPRATSLSSLWELSCLAKVSWKQTLQ